MALEKDLMGRLLLRSAPLLTIGALVFAPACGPRGTTTPHSALHAYTDALEDDRLEDAYALLSADSRAELSFEDFKRLVHKNPKEVQALVNKARSEKNPPLVTAEFTTESGDTLILVYENGAWRIDESAVNLYDQSEPRKALESFIKAFDRKRYDVLLAFVPERDLREGLTAERLKESWEGELRVEMERIVEGLRAHLSVGKLEVLGGRATMSYGAGGVVELIFEDGVWKIEDFQ